MREDDRGPVGAVRRLRIPHDLVKALDASVERVGRVVDREGVGLPVDREAALRDPVGDPPDHRPEARALFKVLGQVVEPEDDVAHPPGPVRYVEFGDHRPIGDDLADQTVGVGQGVEIDGGAFRHRSERGF